MSGVGTVACAEEEGAIFPDGAADGSTEGVLFEGWG